MEHLLVINTNVQKFRTWLNDNTPFTPYATWENEAYLELRHLRVATSKIDGVQNWVTAHPPTP